VANKKQGNGVDGGNSISVGRVCILFDFMVDMRVGRGLAILLVMALAAISMFLATQINELPRWSVQCYCSDCIAIWRVGQPYLELGDNCKAMNALRIEPSFASNWLLDVLAGYSGESLSSLSKIPRDAELYSGDFSRLTVEQNLLGSRSTSRDAMKGPSTCEIAEDTRDMPDTANPGCANRRNWTTSIFRLGVANQSPALSYLLSNHCRKTSSRQSPVVMTVLWTATG
jgi:hypothetical protein